MTVSLLAARDAALRLGIATGTLYSWLQQSDVGEFILRGHAVTIAYRQGGPKGQGRILITDNEIERLLGLLQVKPSRSPRRHTPVRQAYPGIAVPLGRPPTTPTKGMEAGDLGSQTSE